MSNSNFVDQSLDQQSFEPAAGQEQSDPDSTQLEKSASREDNERYQKIDPRGILPTGDKKKQAKIIVVGNEKGGAGKSTVAMHLAIALLQKKYQVGIIDLDIRQKSLSRYVANRKNWAREYDVDLVMPETASVAMSSSRNLDDKENEELERLQNAIQELDRRNNIVIIDTPGSDNFLVRSAHALANLVVTPLNDSFVDFDLLGEIDPHSFTVRNPSIYSQMIWECRKQKAQLYNESIDWIVMRNRMSAIEARNQRRIQGGLRVLAKKIGFRVVPGFGERALFRELFPMGLTVLDNVSKRSDIAVTSGQRAALGEIFGLVDSLNLPNELEVETV